jgi:DNA-binding beta-propeller fold protein YncE
MRTAKLLAFLCAFAAPAAHAGAAPSSAGAGALYVSLSASNQIAIFDRYNGRVQKGTITSGIQFSASLATDRSGTLYVGNHNQTVTVYPFGATAPSATITNGIGFPAYLAIGPDNSLYVSNLDLMTVVQYPPGSTAPSRTIPFNAPQSGIAVGPGGDLFVVTNAGDIQRFKPGATKGESLGIALGTGYSQLLLDKQGNFVVVQPAYGSLQVYAKAKPYNVIHVYSVGQGAGTAAFSASGDALYATDGAGSRVVQIVYPQGNFADVIDNGQFVYANALAVTPAEH